MSMFSSFMNPGRGYQQGQNQLDNYYNQAQGYQQPFVNQGQDAYGGIKSAMDNLLNPEELQNKWSQGYETSQAAQQAQAAAQQHGLDAASSMGLMGSTPGIQAIQAGTSQIGAQDKQSYMDNLMQKYMAGTNLGQGIYNTGANAAGQMGQNAMNQGQNSAQMQFGQQNSGGGVFGNLLGAGVGLLGGALGGPIGTALGAGLVNKMGWSTGGK